MEWVLNITQALVLLGVGYVIMTFIGILFFSGGIAPIPYRYRKKSKK